MKLPFKFSASVVAACAMLTAPKSAAATLEIDATQVGGFFEDGMADNDVTFQNYYVGYSTLSKVEVRRSFFYFDLSGLTDPVLSAEFSLILPFGGLFFGGDGMGGFEVEDFILSPVVDPTIAENILKPTVTLLEGESVWAALGDPGMAVGSAGFDPLMPPIVPGSGLEIIIPIDASGVALINVNLGGDLMLSGRMLDVTPMIPPPETDELIFGLSDVVSMGGIPGPIAAPSLNVVTVPEPGSALLGAFGLVALLGRRKRI